MFKILLLTLLTFCFSASLVCAEPEILYPLGHIIVKGGDQPLPLQMAVDIPFGALEGTWQTMGPSPILFKIKVKENSHSASGFTVKITLLHSSGRQVDRKSVTPENDSKTITTTFDAGQDSLQFKLGAYLAKAPSDGTMQTMFAVKLVQMSHDGKMVSRGSFFLQKIDD